jgi:ABC-type branched-subunit amino acid transport system substrate-binding protein
MPFCSSDRQWWRRRLSIAALGLSLTGAAAASTACGKASGSSNPRADTAFVGVAVGLTSPERYVNVYVGVQLALDELNARKVTGAPVLALRRAPTTAASPVDIAVAFRDDPRVIGVVGHTESAPTIAAAAIYDDRANGGRNPVVAVTPTASATSVTRVSSWVFRVVPVAGEQAAALARFVADSLGLRRAGVVYRNDPSGKDFLRAFTGEFTRRGGTVVERDPFVEEIPDFEPYARRLVKRGVPSVAISGNSAGPLMLALRRAGRRPVVLGANAPSSSDGSADDFRGMRYVQFYSSTQPSTAEGARFAATFARRTGGKADHWAALSYDAAMLIGSATLAEGANRRRVRDWIAAVGRSRPSHQGATGTITFDEHGDPVRKAVLVQEVGR